MIAERVDDEGRHEVPGANEQERRVNAEYRGVEELEERDYDRCLLVHAGPKPLDHVMEMCCKRSSSDCRPILVTSTTHRLRRTAG